MQLVSFHLLRLVAALWGLLVLAQCGVVIERTGVDSGKSERVEIPSPPDAADDSANLDKRLANIEKLYYLSVAAGETWKTPDYWIPNFITSVLGDCDPHWMTVVSRWTKTDATKFYAYRDGSAKILSVSFTAEPQTLLIDMYSVLHFALTNVRQGDRPWSSATARTGDTPWLRTESYLLKAWTTKALGNIDDNTGCDIELLIKTISVHDGAKIIAGKIKHAIQRSFSCFDFQKIQALTMGNNDRTILSVENGTAELVDNSTFVSQLVLSPNPVQVDA